VQTDVEAKKNFAQLSGKWPRHYSFCGVCS